MNLQLKYISRVLLALSVLMPASVYGRSLWLSASNNERSMFADRVAGNIGDILTIVVNETTTEGINYSTTSSKTAAVAASITSIFYPSSGLGNHSGEKPSSAWELEKDDFSGGGTVSDSSNLSFKTSASVIDKLPNGNLIIEGKRELFYANERRFFVISGIVRPDDIKSDNTVASDLIADAEVKIIAEGEISASRNKGWLTKFAEFISPF